MKKTAIEREKETIKKMISIYCKANHLTKNELCPDCLEILNYANKQLERCKFGNEKPTCEKCPIHCYKPKMREQVKKVMRYSGPRMLFKYPIDAFFHFLKK